MPNYIIVKKKIYFLGKAELYYSGLKDQIKQMDL